ncbi:MAG TPA: tetratricopeptide repeat protein [Thermoanaerobaculia bacterium]|nr:tetratricopeptide repeat protein [Thermoanaerobaculia bacterium]
MSRGDLSEINDSRGSERVGPARFLSKYRIWAVLVALVSVSAGLAEVSGFSLRDLIRLVSPATLSDEARAALRAQVRSLAADVSLSVDDSRELRDYVAGLTVDAKSAEEYLSEIKPRMLQAARALQEGAELAAEERFLKARERFREAMRLDDENAAAWANFGGAALELGDAVEAEAALRKALELEPENIEAHYNFGACLAAQNRGAVAFEHLERSLTLLLRSDAPPIFDRQALLDDLERSNHFGSLRGSPRFATLIRRVHDEFR